MTRQPWRCVIPSYIIRNADPELWHAFRARAATEGHSLRWLILELVRRYVAAGLDQRAP
jgi:plasmid stability protein